MENKMKYIIIVAIVIIILMGVLFAINMLMTDDNGNNPLKNLGVVKSEYKINFYPDGSQEGSIESEVDNLKTNPYLSDINNETIKWIGKFQ